MTSNLFQSKAWEQLDSQGLASKTRRLDEMLGWCWAVFGERAAIGTSFQSAGLVIIDNAIKAGFCFPVFTIDTGMLFPETVALKSRLEEFFGIPIESIGPDLSLEDQARLHGPELWRDLPDRCCALRKVAPLQQKLASLGAWITGLRHDQSTLRANTPLLDLIRLDGTPPKQILKLNPLATWTRAEIEDYVARNRIPCNPLSDQGYPSIGCWPCTREAGHGEHERAGRWAGSAKTECGIHTRFGGEGTTVFDAPPPADGSSA